MLYLHQDNQIKLTTQPSGQEHKGYINFIEKIERKQSLVNFFLIWARFQVHTAASMKLTGFWDVAPCSMVEVDRRFGGACCF
jgi:hypothetical protein